MRAGAAGTLASEATKTDVGTTMQAKSSPAAAQQQLPSSSRWIALLLGLGMLTTYNFMLNMFLWFREIYNEPAMPYYGALALTYPGVAVQFLMLPVGRLVPASLRIRFGYAVNLIVLCIVPAIAGRGGYWVGILMLLSSGVATAVMESSLFGYFSAFPPSYNGALVEGQGIAGVVASVIQIATRASIPGDRTTAAYAYCGIGAFVMAVCLGAHAYLVRQPAVAAIVSKAATGRRDSNDHLDVEGLESGTSGVEESSHSDSGISSRAKEPDGGQAPLSVGSDSSADGGFSTPLKQRQSDSAGLLQPSSDSSASMAQPQQLGSPSNPFSYSDLKTPSAGAAEQTVSGHAAVPAPGDGVASSGQWQRLHAVRMMTLGRGAAAGAGDSSIAGAGTQVVPNPLASASSSGDSSGEDAAAASSSTVVESWGSPSAGRHRGPSANNAAASNGSASSGSGGSGAASASNGSGDLRSLARISLRAAQRERLVAVASGNHCAASCSAAMQLSCPSLAHWCADFSRALRIVAIPALVLATNFVATFLPFPGVLSSVKYKGSVGGGGVIPLFLTDSGADWWFTLLLLVFSVADVAGRYAASRHPPLPDWALVCYALIRFGWTPLIAGCAYNWGPAFDDVLIVATVAGFAATNGHLANLCFMQGPTRAAPPDRELAGFCMAAALHVGIVVGSNAALVFA